MKLIALYSTPKDPEAFEDAYFNSHVPLIKKLPGLLEINMSMHSRTLLGEKAPYMISEMKFADKEALKTALNSPEMAKAGENLDSFAKDQYTLIMAESR
jgi:uncharacterized protein (TIGR02118 family)